LFFKIFSAGGSEKGVEVVFYFLLFGQVVGGGAQGADGSVVETEGFGVVTFKEFRVEFLEFFDALAGGFVEGAFVDAV
jgi:hypothetical protein